MVTVTMDMPDSVLAVLRKNPEEFACEMRLTAAVGWYGQGKVSQEVAAQIAGLNRTEFLLALARMQRVEFTVEKN